MSFQLITNYDGVRMTDEAGIVWVVPNDSANRHWQAYQAWLALGNTPDPAE